MRSFLCQIDQVQCNCGSDSSSAEGNELVEKVPSFIAWSSYVTWRLPSRTIFIWPPLITPLPSCSPPIRRMLQHRVVLDLPTHPNRCGRKWMCWIVFYPVPTNQMMSSMRVWSPIMHSDRGYPSAFRLLDSQNLKTDGHYLQTALLIYRAQNWVYEDKVTECRVQTWVSLLRQYQLQVSRDRGATPLNRFAGFLHYRPNVYHLFSGIDLAYGVDDHIPLAKLVITIITAWITDDLIGYCAALFLYLTKQCTVVGNRYVPLRKPCFPRSKRKNDANFPFGTRNCRNHVAYDLSSLFSIWWANATASWISHGKCRYEIQVFDPCVQRRNRFQ